MREFLLDFLTWIFAFIAIGMVLGWLVHLADSHIERGPERHPERYEDGP